MTQSNPQIPWGHLNANWTSLQQKTLLNEIIWEEESLFSQQQQFDFTVTLGNIVFNEFHPFLLSHLYIKWLHPFPSPSWPFTSAMPAASPIHLPAAWAPLSWPPPSSPRLTADLSSSSALKLPLGFTLTPTLPTYSLALMTDGVMQTPRISEDDRRGTRSRREK